MYKGLIIGFATVLLVSCFGSPERHDFEKQQTREHKEALIEVNKQLVRDDMSEIENYAERRGWDMLMTKTGVWYQVYEQGKGAQIHEKQTISFNYTVHLLNGKLCYSSEQDGKPKTVTVGQGEPVHGLDKHLELLKRGDKARFILPPHMAYGMVGDNNKIPMRSTIVYNIEVIDN